MMMRMTSKVETVFSVWSKATIPILSHFFFMPLPFADVFYDLQAIGYKTLFSLNICSLKSDYEFRFGFNLF